MTLLVTFLALIVSTSLPACAQETAVGNTPAKASRRTHWLDRPWEMRYFLYVTETWQSSKRVAKRREEKAVPGSLDREWESIFEPAYFFQSRDRWAKPGDGLSVVLIEFERDGTVKTANAFDKPLRGRLDRLMYVTIAAGSAESQPRFDIGEWFLGVGDASTHWAPGLCATKDMPSPFSKTDTGYLYGPKFEINPNQPSFGCREWAYQLYEPGRPYIDVTSYISKAKDPDGSGAYIREVIGWSGFDDKKPVIGKHEQQWYCLHDCPGGDKPGPIANINKWAAKNGWPAPKRPTRVPTFPDPPGTAGTYPK